jgi:hypothetical protein
MLKDWLETVYWENDFKEKKDYMEYVHCVAMHLYWTICEDCKKNFWKDKINNPEKYDKKYLPPKK